jgi:large subunit ribosomal protein L6
MSRLIKKPVVLPEGVTVSLSGETLAVQGPKGELTVKIVPGVTVTSKEGGVWIEEGKDLANVAMLGTTWALVRNAIEGVTKGFAKKLEIEGVGYRAVVEGKDIMLYLGYAQPVRVPVPDGITVAVEKNTTILLSGLSKENVGQIAAKIRALKKPEPYKGKGIHYEGEVIRRKVGKKAGTTTA